MYYYEDDNELALEYYNKGFAVYQKLYDEEAPEMESFYYNIGSVYMDLENYKQAAFYFDKALNALKKDPNSDKTQIEINLNAYNEAIAALE